MPKLALPAYLAGDAYCYRVDSKPRAYNRLACIRHEALGVDGLQFCKDILSNNYTVYKDCYCITSNDRYSEYVYTETGLRALPSDLDSLLDERLDISVVATDGKFNTKAVKVLTYTEVAPIMEKLHGILPEMTLHLNVITKGGTILIKDARPKIAAQNEVSFTN